MSAALSLKLMGFVASALSVVGVLAWFVVGFVMFVVGLFVRIALGLGSSTVTVSSTS